MDKYLRKDGTITDWLDAPENDSDRKFLWLAPLRKQYARGDRLNHKRFGMLECVTCVRLVNEDQCGDWRGPSFGANFVRVFGNEDDR